VVYVSNSTHVTGCQVLSGGSVCWERLDYNGCFLNSLDDEFNISIFKVKMVMYQFLGNSSFVTVMHCVTSCFASIMCEVESFVNQSSVSSSVMHNLYVPSLLKFLRAVI